MRKILVMLVMAVLGTVLLVGCKDDNLSPYFTRWSSNADCGVVPMLVQFTARASGGDAEQDPTGANSYVTIDWNFGDMGTAVGSIVYHTFTQPGLYNVALTVRDKDGDGETRHILIDARADSLTLRPLPSGDGVEPDTTVAVGDTVQFGLYARTCGLDPNAGDDIYGSRFLINWRMDNVARTSPVVVPANMTYSGRAPRFRYAAGDVGLRHVVLTVTDDQLSVTRRDTVTVLVQAAR